MPPSRRAQPGFVLAVALIVGACGSSAVSPSANPPAPAAATASLRSSSTPSASTVAITSPSASFAPSVDGQIVFEDSGRDFQFTQIWLENADGSNVRQVVTDDATDNSASLSPDGTKIMFYRVHGDAVGTMIIVNTDGSGLHELDSGSGATGCDAGPEGDAWSPDGGRVVFTRTCIEPNGNFVGQGLWTINVDGTGLREVTHNAPAKPCPPPYACVRLEDHRAGWSPDSKQLVFERIDTSTDPERAAIFTIGIDGKHSRQVTPWKLDGNDPDWSPDGKLIAFNATAEPSPTQNIYTIHPDGTGLAQLTTYNQEGQATYHPSWSPDGKQLLFAHAPSTDGWADFFMMDRDGSNQHVIAKTALHENHGQWGSSPAP